MSAEQRNPWKVLARFNPWRVPRGDKGDEKRRRWWRISRRRIVFWSCAFLATVGVGVYLRAEIHRRVLRLGDYSLTSNVRIGGTLLIVGGGQLPDVIRQRFVELAGGRQARIVVIPAEEVDLAALEQHREVWLRYDVNSVEVLHADSRTQADDPEFSRILDRATGVWIGGGRQTLLASWYGQTIVESRLKELLSRNGVIGGTSAGAAIMSNVMIAGGREKPTMGQGFDLIPGAIIDQHFVKRNRVRRLQTALEMHPELVGFGIDEGAALQYNVDSGRFRVIGQSCVIGCVPRIESDQRTTFRLEFFNPGDDFDVERLRLGDAVPTNYLDLDSILLGE